jgi:hypothetical protein
MGGTESAMTIASSPLAPLASNATVTLKSGGRLNTISSGTPSPLLSVGSKLSQAWSKSTVKTRLLMLLPPPAKVIGSVTVPPGEATTPIGIVSDGALSMLAGLPGHPLVDRKPAAPPARHRLAPSIVPANRANAPRCHCHRLWNGAMIEA